MSSKVAISNCLASSSVNNWTKGRGSQVSEVYISVWLLVLLASGGLDEERRGFPGDPKSLCQTVWLLALPTN